MRTRDWSVRTKILALLLVPFVALVALWFAATGATMDAARGLTAARAYRDYARTPGERLVDELQRERARSMVYLGAGRTDPKPLADQRARVDTALATFRRRVPDAKLTGLAQRRLRELSATLEMLPAARDTIDGGELDRAGTMRLYNGMVDTAYRLFLPLTDVGDWDVAWQGRSAVALGRSREALAREDALLGGVAAAGKFTGADLGQLVQAIGAQRTMFADAAAELPTGYQAAYQRVVKAPDAGRLQALEDRVVSDGRVGSPVPVDMAVWRSAYDTVTRQLRDVERAARNAAAAATGPVAGRVFDRLWLASLLGLASLIGSALLAWWLSRSLVGRLRGLRDAASQLALTRLPGLTARLRSGADIDLAAEVPAPTRDRDEIGQVGRAFDEVQRAIVRSVVADARLRHGLADVFSTITQRSQDLMHRQLTLLDGMERRITEPADLEDLFRVDHLVTRTRRHAEELAVLAGAVPGRGWHSPVPMTDVIRGAVSEVEEYSRVAALPVPDVALVGRAVGDTIHLLAELIENGTVFAPDTRVQVSGELVPNGFAIAIEDRGAGMSAAEIANANRRLAQPPEFDPVTGTQLGLFMVSRLAARHDIRVRLRPSPFGGITAVVLIPPELVVVGPDSPPIWEPPAPPARTQPARTQPAPKTATATAMLPQRVRQANLAPQLREAGTPGP